MKDFLKTLLSLECFPILLYFPLVTTCAPESPSISTPAWGHETRAAPAGAGVTPEPHPAALPWPPAASPHQPRSGPPSPGSQQAHTPAGPAGPKEYLPSVLGLKIFFIHSEISYTKEALIRYFLTHGVFRHPGHETLTCSLHKGFPLTTCGC